jgi:uncharacterized cupin superfamily protein
MAGENASQKVNLFEEFTGRLDIAGALGSEETAMFLYDVDPGESLPYHYEYVEEWLLVVDGTVVVRTPERDHELHRGDLVRYPAGPEGAHQVADRRDTSARVLLFSKVAVPAVSVIPTRTTRSAFGLGCPSSWTTRSRPRRRPAEAGRRPGSDRTTRSPRSTRRP